MRTNNRTSDGARISDLLDRLIETENSELKLKERVWNLEKKEKELQIKVNSVLVHQLLLWYQSHTRLAILLNQLRPCNNYSSADFWTTEYTLSMSTVPWTDNILLKQYMHCSTSTWPFLVQYGVVFMLDTIIDTCIFPHHYSVIEVFPFLKSHEEFLLRRKKILFLYSALDLNPVPKDGIKVKKRRSML